MVRKLPQLGTAETYEPAKRVVRSRCGLPLAIPYLVMFTKGPLHVPITSGSIAGGVTWGLRNGFDVAPRGARAPRAWPRAYLGEHATWGGLPAGVHLAS